MRRPARAAHLGGAGAVKITERVACSARPRRLGHHSRRGSRKKLRHNPVPVKESGNRDAPAARKPCRQASPARSSAPIHRGTAGAALERPDVAEDDAVRADKLLIAPPAAKFAETGTLFSPPHLTISAR